MSFTRALRSASAYVPSVGTRAASFWVNVPMGPKDPILGVAENFKVGLIPILRCSIFFSFQFVFTHPVKSPTA